MTDWNPNDTATLGLEWFPYRSGKVRLNSRRRAAALSLVQTAAEQIEAATLFVDDVDPGPPAFGGAPWAFVYPQPGIYAMEVFDNEDAVVDPSTVTVLTARPNQDVSFTGWTTNTGATSNLYQQIDDRTETEWITNNYGPGAGNNYGYFGRVDTGALSLTGRRILGVRLRARVVRAFADNYTQVTLGLSIDVSPGGMFTAQSMPFWLPMWQWTTIEYTWTYNPVYLRPWTIADVQQFDTSDEVAIMPYSFYGAGNITCYWLEMEVITCPETRLAFSGFSQLTSGDNDKHIRTDRSWLNPATLPGSLFDAELKTPTGGSWTKDSSGRHLYVVRRMSDSGAISLPTLDAVTEQPLAGSGPRSFAPILDPTYGYVTEMGDPLTQIWSLGQYRSTNVFSVDSQPYSIFGEALVYTGQDAEQEVSGAAATLYGLVRFLVKPRSATANLDIKIKRRSDNVQLGTTYTLDPDDVDPATLLDDADFIALENGWYLAQVQLGTPATLAAATQYYVEFSSAAASGSPWAIGLLTSHLSDDAGATLQGVGSYNDATDRALANGNELDRYDLPVTIATLPATPTGFAATLDSDALPGETVCGTDAIPFVHLAWTGSATMSQELDRSEDGGISWARIAELPASGATSYVFDDYEGKFGITPQYRVRQRRADKAVSLWTATASIAKPFSTCPTLFLVSNFAPSENTAIDYDARKGIAFLEADDVVFHAVYGRDGQLTAQPTEERGLTYSIDVTVAADDRTSAAGRGIDAFATIRGIARARIPYVCVLDHYGTRIFATLRVPQGEIIEPERLYTAPVEATTIVVEPYVVTAQ